MNEIQWEPLAEIYLNSKDINEDIYCLCSRVFVRNKDERLKTSANLQEELSASETEFFNKEDDYVIESADPTTLENLDLKHDVDVEVVSCYCSASHTDNISTDEHDSLRDSSQLTRHSLQYYTPGGSTNTQRTPIPIVGGLQSSDSGADLTEHLRSSSTSCLSTNTAGPTTTSNIVSLEQDAAWLRFWSQHGERLIWVSWIDRYSDYINPQYLKAAASCGGGGEVKSAGVIEVVVEAVSTEMAGPAQSGGLVTQFSFEKRDIERVEKDRSLGIIDENRELLVGKTTFTDATLPKPNFELTERNRILVRNLSGSDSTDRLQNLLLNDDISPEHDYHPLTSSPAANTQSSLSEPIDTTEIERLLSSRCGSHTSGASVRTVDSMTNVTRMTISSIDLSTSSSKSSSTGSFSSVSSVQSSLSSSAEEFDENAQDYEQQWNNLWRKHYEEEYLRQYSKFFGQDSLQQQQQQRAKIKTSGTSSINSSVEEADSTNIKAKLQRTAKKSLESVEQLLSSLNMDLAETKSIEDPEELELDAMEAMGLPVNFGYKKAGVKRTLETAEESEDKASSSHVKSAFKLMGIEFEEKGGLKFKGSVDYKMKHIRLQNRQLKLHHKQEKRAKHIYFDEDGYELNSSEKETMDEGGTTTDQGILSDTLEIKLSSSSDSEEIVNKTTSLLSLQPGDVPMKVNKKKKKKRKLALPQEIKDNPKLRKYWEKRFTLFNKFDQGIKLDEESWYSVTPELVAKHTAERCQCDVVIDAFCGAGGNAIQFAATCNQVIAIDIDPQKIELARHNARIYGVEDKIEFIVADFIQLALNDSLRGDVVFLSPPWGGPNYLNLPCYDLEEMLQPLSLTELLTAARKITNNVALYLPRNSNTHDIFKAAGPGGYAEIEQNFINKKLIAITAYYNDLIQQI